LSSPRPTIEPEDENKEDSSSLILCRSCFMILKYSSSNFIEAIRVKG
jgi:hypothetical protein